MNLEYLNNDETYVVGVSGGPDSMALLHALINQQIKCHVAHINYNLRPSSLRDQRIVEDFCVKYAIPYSIRIVEQKPVSNLQAWARRIRYEFFETVAKENNLLTVLIAHQKDDDIETYSMQKLANKKPDYFGIQPISQYKSIRVVRPMIHIYRNEIIDYCEHNMIIYGIDESNLKPQYLRNRIRIQLSQLSIEAKEHLYHEMIQRNICNEKNQKSASDFLMKNNIKNGIKIESILSLDSDVQNEVARRILHEYKGNNGYFRQATIMDFIQWLRDSRDGDSWGVRQFTILRKKTDIMIEDGIKMALDLILESPQSTISSGGYRFTFDQVDSDYKIFVSDDDFPLRIISPYPKGSRLTLKNGHQKVSRYFINNKVESHLRNSIPVIINNSGTVIGIVGFYTQVRRKHMQHTLTVIK